MEKLPVKLKVPKKEIKLDDFEYAVIMKMEEIAEALRRNNG